MSQWLSKNQILLDPSVKGMIEMWGEELEQKREV